MASITTQNLSLSFSILYIQIQGSNIYINAGLSSQVYMNTGANTTVTHHLYHHPGQVHTEPYLCIMLAQAHVRSATPADAGVAR